ncbi:hypothetical protein INR49_028511, partial [Caranx melampygus]
KPPVCINMAASGKHVGHCLQRNGRFVINNLEQLWGHRSFGWTPALRQQAVEANKESTGNYVIPRKKTWSKEAVLEALASTVSKCLMPETLSLQLEEVSEEALKERINLRKVTAAVDMYDQLLQAGTTISMETTHDLLDLICLYCDADPEQDDITENVEEMVSHQRSKPQSGVQGCDQSGFLLQQQEMGEEAKKRKRIRRVGDFMKPTWKENNNAERIFNLLPEKDTRCYSALIRGMVKHEAHAKAFSMYTDMLNNRVTADIHIYNALISAAPYVREKEKTERWDLIAELLTEMNQQKIRPSLITFNCVLRALRRCGPVAKTKSLQTLNEMKALGIDPSLATYDHVLSIAYKSAFSGPRNMDILHHVMSELEGRSFTCQDPGDVTFFATAIKICLDFKDLEMGYKVQSLLEVGENWRLLGDPYQQSIYYGRFFTLVCLMEHIDVVLKWYKQLIPSLYYPSIQGMMGLLQALDTDSRLDLLPQIWKDICSMGHDNKLDLVEEMLSLMARENHSPEVQESFAMCALDIKKVFDDSRRRPSLEWSTPALTHIPTLLLRANMTQQAWEMLQLFKSNNRVPSTELLDRFLTAFHSDGSPQRAVDLVQLSAAFCLPETPKLAKRTLAEFDLTKEQRAILSELESAGDSSD